MALTGDPETEITLTTHASGDEEANLYAMQVTRASVLPMVLKAALELDVLEIMAKSVPPGGGYISPAEIASQLPTTNPDAAVMLDRLLRLLASCSIVTCTLRELPGGEVERLYGLAPVCRFLTKNEDGVSFATFCLFVQDKVPMESWYYLKDVILEGGIPFNKAHGLSIFDYTGTDPRVGNIFNRAMSDNSTITMKKILENYKGFEGLGTVVDVGGGTGAVLRMVVVKYPSIRGINFDLPHVIENAPSYPGVEHVGGDMFVSIPKGDAIFMKFICHDWSDEHCLKFLKKCYDALPNHGKVIVAEHILPLSPDSSLTTKTAIHFDILMLTLTRGGKERTDKEFEALAKGAGFQGFKVVCSALNIYVMEFLKKGSSIGDAESTQITPTQTHVSVDEEANIFAIQLATASVLPMVLKASIELNVLEIMANSVPLGGHISPAEIASQLSTTNPDAPVILDRVLRLLASYSVVTCTLREPPGGKVERLYGLAPVSKFLSKDDNGVSLASFCLSVQDKVLMETWYYFKDAILEGGVPFHKAYGMSAVEYIGTDPRVGNILNRAMSDHSTITMKKILETYNGFEGLGTVVDVGGGTGALISMVVAKYPSIKGINFDLPYVIKQSPSYPGVEHVGGDMFVSIPKSDAMFMKFVCHDWSDEHCLKFLKNCYDSLPSHGKVIVADAIIPLSPDSSLATKRVIYSDILMFAYSSGGKERTEKEFEVLAKGAGFQGFKVACCAFSTYIMEFLKTT